MSQEQEKPLNELLGLVNSRESFMQFVAALIADRQKADALEAIDAQRHRFAGANNWNNSSIDTFLQASLAYMQYPRWVESEVDQPTWRDLAQFLFMGKIYE